MGIHATADWVFDPNPNGTVDSLLIVAAGDVNGDRLADVLVRHDDEVSVDAGQAGGISTVPLWQAGADPDFGPRIGSAGDLDADGYGEIALGR